MLIDIIYGSWFGKKKKKKKNTTYMVLLLNFRGDVVQKPTGK